MWKAGRQKQQLQGDAAMPLLVEELKIGVPDTFKHSYF